MALITHQTQGPHQTAFSRPKSCNHGINLRSFEAFQLVHRTAAFIPLKRQFYSNIPFYFTVRMVYGAEVTKELTPMWVLGPLIVALYVKIIQRLCSLYVFCFVSAVKLVKNLPSYYLLVSNYISRGELRGYIWAHFGKPVKDFRNLDYKEMFVRLMKQLREWAVEKYLDYVESIWPYYCRTIRFLKKANLI